MVDHCRRLVEEEIQEEIVEKAEDGDPPSILEQILIIATVASVITLFMSDPIQREVNGKKFEEGYRYITMNGKLNELDESYRYSNCKQLTRTKTNSDNIYYCQVDPEYIVEKDGTFSARYWLCLVHYYTF